MKKSTSSSTGQTPADAGPNGALGSDDGSHGQKKSVVYRQKKLREILNRVLTGEVIPRVYEASGAPSAPQDGTDEKTVQAFCHCILEGDEGDSIAFVQQRIDAGASLRALCLGLFTVTALELGEMWSDDELSFAEVTIGLGRLHKLVHQFSALDSALHSPGARHNIILASAPAEQHAFGVLLVSKIFEMEGWLVTGGPDLRTGNDLTALISKSWFDVVGLSASSEGLAYTLRSAIETVRAVSLNPDVFVMVGGAGFSSGTVTAADIGADDLAKDADEAIKKARSLLNGLEARTKN